MTGAECGHRPLAVLPPHPSRRRAVPEALQGAAGQLYGVAQDPEAAEPQGVLAQVQSGQGAVDDEGGGEVGAAERGDGAAPQPADRAQAAAGTQRDPWESRRLWAGGERGHAPPRPPRWWMSTVEWRARGRAAALGDPLGAGQRITGVTRLEGQKGRDMQRLLGVKEVPVRFVVKWGNRSVPLRPAPLRGGRLCTGKAGQGCAEALPRACPRGKPGRRPSPSLLGPGGLRVPPDLQSHPQQQERGQPPCPPTELSHPLQAGVPAGGP